MTDFTTNGTGDVDNTVAIAATDIAHTLESTSGSQRTELWESLTPREQGETLPHINSTLTASLLEKKNVDEVAAIAKNMGASQIVELIEAIADDLGSELIDSLDGLEKQHVEENMQYQEGTLGRLIGYSVITMKADRAVAHVLAYIRNNKLPAFTDKVFIVGKKNKLLGAVSLAALLEASLDKKIGELDQLAELAILNPNMSKHEAATLFRQQQFISQPIVDENGILLGRVTFDKVLDIATTEADKQILGMAGLQQELDLFSAVIPSAKRRAVWLGINLLTAILASWSIGLFSATLEQVVALAILMPIVASMGGIAGSQTLTLTIRGLALDNVNKSNRNALLKKEVGVAVLNGLLWSVVVGIVVLLWFSDIRLSIVITMAIFVNSVTAALTGWAIPLILNAYKIDPAIAGSVILTTFTDIIGFVLFLGLGTILLL
ncbi:MAG: magnesium transporter [Arenicella sp.]|jgi:magnesium transporter